jgi:hypothetical protein
MNVHRSSCKVPVITTIQATNKVQQFRFIDPFKSALHVSGANYANPQEHCIYSFWYDTPTLLPSRDIVKVDRVTGRQQSQCIIPKAVNTKCS